MSKFWVYFFLGFIASSSFTKASDYPDKKPYTDIPPVPHTACTLSLIMSPTPSIYKRNQHRNHSSFSPHISNSIENTVTSHNIHKKKIEEFTDYGYVSIMNNDHGYVFPKWQTHARQISNSIDKPVISHNTHKKKIEEFTDHGYVSIMNNDHGYVFPCSYRENLKWHFTYPDTIPFSTAYGEGLTSSLSLYLSIGTANLKTGNPEETNAEFSLIFSLPSKILTQILCYKGAVKASERVCKAMEKLRQSPEVRLKLLGILHSMEHFKEISSYPYPTFNLKFKFTPSTEELRQILANWSTIQYVDLSDTHVKDASCLNKVSIVILPAKKEYKIHSFSNIFSLNLNYNF